MYLIDLSIKLFLNRVNLLAKEAKKKNVRV